MKTGTRESDSRRSFLKKFSLMGGLAVAGTVPSAAAVEWLKNRDDDAGEGMLSMGQDHDALAYRPMDEVRLEGPAAGEIRIFDGNNRQYVQAEAKEDFTFIAAGALGKHLVLYLDKKGRPADFLTLRVEDHTRIEDASGKFRELMDVLYYTMTNEWGREAGVVRYNGSYYHNFVGWIRDHVHTLKGMKYFYPEVKTGIDLYAHSQREDGMIWDNYNKRPAEGDYWEQRFDYADFVRVVDQGKREFRRIPVENDVEYLFIEGMYYTWKASGDDAWMKGLLDHALKAVDYSTSSPYRWSEKYRLLKRGYTIDTWDFQNDEDAAISTGPGQGGDPMVIKLPYTRFGIMFGDNTGMAASCAYLAEMLEYAGRKEESQRISKLGEGLKERLDRLSWNGEFYTHHVPEAEGLERDLGVDEGSQVSLSNAYSLNRKLSEEQAEAIIRSYQRIREEMPGSSPGEWYTIYPPFGKGFGSHNTLWSYMNGGVTTIVAGELAHGAFEHGQESYAVDILERLLKLAGSSDGYLHCTYRGALEPAPERNFSCLSLAGLANTDTHGYTVKGVAGWTGEGDNDLHEFPSGRQVFHEIPFEVVDPEANGRKACLGLSGNPPYADEAELEVGKQARSLYILHTTGKSYYAGKLELVYEDGSVHVDHIGPGKISNWWYPSAPQNRKQMPRLRVAWRGKNSHSRNVGVSLYGLNNPHPDKQIRSIRFKSAGDATQWMVLGVTLSDYPVFFMPDPISAGIPDNWGAAAVVYALVEGLCGVVDRGTGFDKLELSPRWAAAGEEQARVCIHYPSSDGYVSYTCYRQGRTLELRFTGTMKECMLRLLLPEGRKATGFKVNGETLDYKIQKKGGSSYLLAGPLKEVLNHVVVQLDAS